MNLHSQIASTYCQPYGTVLLADHLRRQPGDYHIVLIASASFFSNTCLVYYVSSILIALRLEGLGRRRRTATILLGWTTADVNSAGHVIKR